MIARTDDVGDLPNFNFVIDQSLCEIVEPSNAHLLVFGAKWKSRNYYYFF